MRRPYKRKVQARAASPQVRLATRSARLATNRLQMPHRERAVPFVIEVCAHEPTVAVMRLRLGAQETRSVEQLRLETMLNSSFRHEVEKTRLVSRPLPLVLLVGLEHGVRRREQRLMHIRDPADPVEEIGEVIGLGKTGELRGIVQAHVHHLLHAGGQKPLEKPLRARLRKADGRDARFRQVSVLRNNLAMQVACTWGQWLGLRLRNPGRPTREYHEPPRDSTRMSLVAICGLLLVHRLGFVWPRKRTQLAPPWVRLAKTARDSSSYNQGECDTALIVNNRQIYNDFSAAG